MNYQIGNVKNHIEFYFDLKIKTKPEKNLISVKFYRIFGVGIYVSLSTKITTYIRIHEEPLQVPTLITLAKYMLINQITINLNNKYNELHESGISL